MPINLLGTRRRKRSKKRVNKTACKTARGRLRKGWRFGKGGRCIRAKGAKARKRRRR